MSEKEKDESEDDLDDLLDQTFERQGLIHHKCQMRDDSDKKKKNGKKKTVNK